MIYILYATKVNIGGWATFTRHLMDCFQEQGVEYELVKVGNNTEQFSRPFGPNHSYRNMSGTDLLKAARHSPMIIAALGKHYVDLAQKLIKRGAKMVVHDTAESANRMGLVEPWVIRRALLPVAPGARFIRHPYVRHAKPTGTPFPRAGLAVATSRVDFDKNTRMILDAKRLGADIKIVGFENRLYTRFKICPDYPEWVQSPGTHPRTGAGSFEECLAHKFMVDLTDIKGDGGGTQYTFLEAWDAGAVPIIGGWWVRPKDDMKPAENCIAIADAHDLYETLRGHKRMDLGAFREAGTRQLKKHSSKRVVPEILDWLMKGR